VVEGVQGEVEEEHQRQEEAEEAQPEVEEVVHRLQEAEEEVLQQMGNNHLQRVEDHLQQASN